MATEPAICPSEPLSRQALEGFLSHYDPFIHQKLGAQRVALDASEAIRFAVWAPHASAIHVVGDFNHWAPTASPLNLIADSGVWETSIPQAHPGQRYRYLINGPSGEVLAKLDPFALESTRQPETASRINLSAPFAWRDQSWMQERTELDWRTRPVSIYEVHLSSWRHPRWPDTDESLFRWIAEPLAQYAQELGFTHVAFLPLAEHPFGGSWGYQVTGYFSPASGLGHPEDLQYLIDTLHRYGIGAIMDWVPAHFCKDSEGLYRFDGTPLFEYASTTRGHHPEWGTAIFDYQKPEVISFLIASALSWLERFHFDGVRVDAVASMIYRDYSRASGDWSPNQEGGQENLEAIQFLKLLNQQIGHHFPGVLRIAEESSAWPGITRSPELGGLGFDLKWNLGWMHDSLSYFTSHPSQRAARHDRLSLPSMYQSHEAYCLPLSHDEVVHEKASLLGKMPGDSPAERASHLRALLAWMWAWPGKKLLFMGGEFGQPNEWDHDSEIDWQQLRHYPHKGIQTLVRWLNRYYTAHPTLCTTDCAHQPLHWLEANDRDAGVFSFARVAEGLDPWLVVVGNFSPSVTTSYRVGVPRDGLWTVDLCSEWLLFHGREAQPHAPIASTPVPWQGQPYSITIDLPSSSTCYLSPLPD